MPKIAYMLATIGSKNLLVVDQANTIIKEYQDQGYKLTLRQLYYQFVSRGWLENTVQNYKRLGDIVNDGRLQGLIDWDAIEDRTRGLETIASWHNPAEIIDSAAYSYKIDMWAHQDFAVEVWVEKEALAGVIEQATRKHRVPYLSCRGYTSQSEMWLAGRRLATLARQGKDIIILHLGDHDPSGIDMSRDIQDRLRLFMVDQADRLTFKRIALNMDQIEQYTPPPNPAKTTDSRYNSYRASYGDESWELDALNPEILDNLIGDALTDYRNDEKWDEDKEREDQERAQLKKVARTWPSIIRALNGEGDD